MPQLNSGTRPSQGRVDGSDLLAMAMVALGLMVFATLIWQNWIYTVDDAFITFRHSQHLALGQGAVYNIGEHVEGYTNPLWMAWCSLAFFLHIDVEIFAKASNVIFVLVTAWSLWKCARAFLPVTMAALAVSVFLCAPAIALSAVEGLETSLLTMLLFVGVWRFFEDETPWLAVLCFSGVALTRPEGILFGAAFLLLSIPFKRRLSYSATFAAIFIGICGAHLAWRLHFYGFPFPNTYYAKGVGSMRALLNGKSSASAFRREYGGALWGILTAGVLLPHPRRWQLLAMLGCVAGRLWFHVWSGGAVMGHHRFLVPTIPFLIVLGACGTLNLLRAIGSKEGVTHWRQPFHSSAIQFVALAGVGFCFLLRALHAYPAWHHEYNAYGQGLRRAHIAWGREVQRLHPEGTVMAMDDAGASAFYAGSRVRNIDMLGLCDAHIAHMKGRFQKKFDVDYVLAQRPEYIVLLSNFPTPTKGDFKLPGHEAMWQSAEFQQHYHYSRNFSLSTSYFLLVFQRS